MFTVKTFALELHGLAESEGPLAICIVSSIHFFWQARQKTLRFLSSSYVQYSARWLVFYTFILRFMRVLVEVYNCIRSLRATIPKHTEGEKERVLIILERERVIALADLYRDTEAYPTGSALSELRRKCTYILSFARDDVSQVSACTL